MPTNPDTPVIALEARLKACRNVTTLGVRTNFNDYSTDERAMIRGAPKIYYPTAFYADLLDSTGKALFPSYHTYKCVQDKIKQTALFELLDIPHPRTRVFYGLRRQRKISNYFTFPFIAKVARGSAMGRGVYLIRNPDDLAAYLAQCAPAYIQQYVPARKDLRVVVIGARVAVAYWRIAAEGEYRSNLAQGATISMDAVPQAAIDLALTTARKCGWDDVGIDICRHAGQYYVLEANMKYGKEGFRHAGIDYIHYMEKMIADEHI